LTVSLILDTSFGTVSRSCVFKCKSGSELFRTTLGEQNECYGRSSS
jgi:hypothetical protein